MWRSAAPRRACVASGCAGRRRWASTHICCAIWRQARFRASSAQACSRRWASSRTATPSSRQRPTSSGGFSMRLPRNGIASDGLGLRRSSS
eukprot:4387499-Lingulodinium_polyedra.AAC.1